MRGKQPMAIVAAVLGLVALTVIRVTAATEKDVPANARQQFDRHNYREALRQLDDYLKAQPEGPAIVDVQVMRAQCLLKLERWDEGKRLLQGLFEKHGELAKRPELHQVLGEQAQRHGDMELAVKELSVSADLFAGVGKKHDTAEVLFKLADVLRHYHGPLRDVIAQQALPAPADDWQAQRKRTAEVVAKTYDRIVALDVDEKTSAEALFRKAQTLRDQFAGIVPYEQSLEAWRKLVTDYAKSPRAAEAAFQIGLTLEQRMIRYVDAVVQYEKVQDQFGGTTWARKAADQIKAIKRPELSLRVEGPTLPGKKAEIQWRTRNLKTVELKAFKVELFEMIRKFNMPEQFSQWKPTGAPSASWQLRVPDNDEHKYIASGQENLEPTRLPITDPGAFVVEATGRSSEGHSVRAVVLVLVSQLGVVAKTGKTQSLVYAVDSVSGQPKPGTQVLIQRRLQNNRFEYKDGAADDAGIHRMTYPVDRNANALDRQLGFIVRSGDHYAVCRDLYAWGWWGYDQPYRVYGFTDRPVYRPDQTVYFKEIVCRHDRGRFEVAPNQKATIRIRDPRGNVVFEQSMTTNAEGSFDGELKLAHEPPLGVYVIDLEIDGRGYGPWQCRGNQFRVEEYKKPEFTVEVTPAKPAYRIGDEVQIRIKADYYFGQPVAGAQVEYEVWKSEFHSTYHPDRPFPWYFDAIDGDIVRIRGPMRSRRMVPPLPDRYGGGRRELVTRGQATTDAKGIATIGPIKAEPYRNQSEVDLQFEVTARVVDKSRREIQGAGSVKVTHAPFFIHLRPQRYLYKPGDHAQVDIIAKGPNDDPIAFEGTASVYRLTSKLVEKDGQQWTEYELGDRLQEMPVKVDAQGRGSFRYPFDEEGMFRAIVSTKTAQGDEVTGQCDLWIAQRGGEYAHYAYRDLELVLDRDSYEIGQPLRVLINSRHTDGYVLLTGDTDDVLFHQVVTLKGKSKLVELPIGVEHTPNFHLTAVLLRDDKIHEDRKLVIVPPTQQFLAVDAKPSKPYYQPREKGQIVITARDSAGKPVEAELAVMMVDASIYYIAPEAREQIQKFFYGQLRPLMVSTRSSFGYQQYGRGKELRDTSFGLARRLGEAGGANDAVMEMAARPMPAAMPARMAKAKGAPDTESEEVSLVEAMVRKEFADAVLWLAHVKTDAKGEAIADVTMPDNLTTWKLHAIACDKQTRVGEKSIDIVTKKDLIVRLETPRFLVEKDMVYVSAIVHNYLKSTKKAQVELKVTPQIKITDARSASAELAIGEAVKGPQLWRRWVEVPAEQEVQVDFVCHAEAKGEVTLLAKALTDEVSDAMELKIPVLEYGADTFHAQSGYLGDVAEGEVELTVAVPAEIKASSQSLELIANPSIATVMIDAMPYLLEYPYGCTEQTMSRFLPAVVTAKALQKLGISLEDVAKKVTQQGGPENKRLLAKLGRNPVYSTAKMNDMIKAGLKRLAEFQQSDGGWGWWKNDQSNPYMTAYVVYGLTEAREADVAFDASILKRGVEFLKKRVASTETVGRYSWVRDEDNVRTWMLYALAWENPGNILASGGGLGAALQAQPVRAVLDRIFKDRDGLTDYARAMLAITLARLGDRNRAGVVIENLGNTIRLDEKTETASWGRTDNWWYWYDSGLETTAMVLRAYVAVDPKHKHIPMIVRWLVQNRRGSQWYSTKDTALCVYALAGYLQASGELDPDMTVAVQVDGKMRNELRVTKANVLTLDATTPLGPEDLTPGKHTIKVRKQGRGFLYVSSFLRYYTREDPIKAAGHQVAVARSYVRLVPKEVTKTRQVWREDERKNVTEEYKTIEYDRVPVGEGEELVSGTRLEVCLQIEAKNNFEYLIFEDPKPAGCEPVELVSGSSYAGGTYANMELRDTRVVFFATYLSQGAHKLTYQLRCETPGVFHALPSRAEAMYTPYVKAISDSARLAIVEKK